MVLEILGEWMEGWGRVGEERKKGEVQVRLGVNWEQFGKVRVKEILGEWVEGMGKGGEGIDKAGVRYGEEGR